MKTRNSLVSNSSSSSFITTRPIDEVAVEMMQVVLKDSLGFYDDKCDDYAKNMKKCMKRMKSVVKKPEVLSGEIGIAFPSINGPSYIIKSGDKVYIDTVNNHNWDDINGLTYVSDERKYDDDITHPSLAGGHYCYVQTDKLLIGSKECWEEAPKDKHCPKCGSGSYVNYIMKDGVYYCLQHEIPFIAN